MINLAKLLKTENIAIKQVVFFELDFFNYAYSKLYLYILLLIIKVQESKCHCATVLFCLTLLLDVL